MRRQLAFPRGRRVLELDGLRGLAILLVLLFHIVLSLPTIWKPVNDFMLFGWSGVDLFFVLSGFLIGGILLDNRDSGSYFRTFYARRFFRIVPLYFAIMVIYAAFWFPNRELREWMRTAVGGHMAWWSYLTFTNNLWIALHDNMKMFLPVSWSLAIEEQFYLTLPALVLLLSRRALTRFVAWSIAGVFALRTFAAMSGLASQNSVYVLPWFRADALLIGVAAALTVRSYSVSQWLRQHAWVLYTVGALLLAVILTTGGKLPEDHGSPITAIMTYGLTAIALFYGVLLLIAALNCSRPLSAVLRLWPLRELGKVSYCVYLIHVTAFRLAFWYFDVTPFAMVLALVSMFAVAEFSWKYFEEPLMHIGHRYRYEPPAAQPQEAPLDEAPAALAS